MSSPPINVFVFDLTGVIFAIHKMKIMRNIASKDLLVYFLKQRKNPVDEGIMILDKMRKEVPGQYQEIVGYKGTYLPLCFVQWNQGLISAAQAFEQIRDYFTHLDTQNYFKNSQHKKILFELLYDLFNSEKSLDAFKPIKSTVNLIQKLRKSGTYKLYILSNIDKETIDGLEALHKDIFSNFDGIVTSCYSHFLKPDVAIFDYLFTKYGLNPRDCCFIDDQIENIKAAQGLGMETIHCVKPSALHSLIKKKGIL